jgi:hypothetical protein
MTQLADVAAASPGPGHTTTRRDLVRWIGTKNPFYALSAMLVLVGLWTSFGAQARPEQTWALMFGLGGYTLLLAVPASLLVRFARVWDDVRTVLLLVVLMFLATSVTFDESLARNPSQGIACYVIGLAFAIAMSEGILRTIRLTLPTGFRVPYYLFLALFFLYPIGLVPLLASPHSAALQWALFGFSAAAGIIALTLLPAIRRGPDYLRGNGSPWRWPFYPWALFVFLAVAVAARAFLLCWSMQHIERTDPERFIFGPYFLVPFVLGIAVLLLEIGITSRSQRTVVVALSMPILATMMAVIGYRPDALFQGFLAQFREQLGATPLYLTVVATACFFSYAALRRQPLATELLSASLIGLAFVAPSSLDVHHLSAARPWPMLGVATLQLALGLQHRRAWRCLAGVSCLVIAAMVWPSGTGVVAIPYRGPLLFHMAALALLVVGAIFDDAFGRFLRNAGAATLLLTCLVVASGAVGRAYFPSWLLVVYVPVMACVLAGYGMLVQHRMSLAASALAGGAWILALAARGYGALRHVVAGLDFIALGIVLLLVAHAVSLAKAGVLRRPKGSGPGDVGREMG